MIKLITLAVLAISSCSLAAKMKPVTVTCTFEAVAKGHHSFVHVQNMLVTDKGVLLDDDGETTETRKVASTKNRKIKASLKKYPRIEMAGFKYELAFLWDTISYEHFMQNSVISESFTLGDVDCYVKPGWRQ